MRHHDAPTKLGTELTSDERAQVLRFYVHRFTGDNRPAWSRKEWKDGKRYPLQFKNDAEWLANTRFAVTKTGKLDNRATECMSTPTWPENPELRKGN